MANNLNKQLTAKSVKAGDDFKVNEGGGVFRLMIPWGGFTDPNSIQIPLKPYIYWSASRDQLLRSTTYHEPFWAASVGIGITKIASLSWDIESDQPRTAQKFKDMLLQADRMRVGWAGFIAKNVRDFLTTDNGSFIEIVRASSAMGSKIVGIRHLDSLRCMRTGDPVYPLIYKSRDGKEHILKDYQVIMLSDMPDAAEDFNGVGLCAASRAYDSIFKMIAMDWLIKEKVSGLRPLAIHIVNGILDSQIKEAVDAQTMEAKAQGIQVYMGAIMIGSPATETPSLVTIPLAEIPTGYDRKREFDMCLLNYADALGVDVQDLQPLSGQGLGTGTQSQMLHEKAAGKGLAFYRQSLTYQINQYVMSEVSKFVFTEKDMNDLANKANVATTRAAAASSRITAGITSPEQEFEMLQTEDDIDEEMTFEADKVAEEKQKRAMETAAQFAPEPGATKPGFASGKKADSVGSEDKKGAKGKNVGAEDKKMKAATKEMSLSTALVLAAREEGEKLANEIWESAHVAPEIPQVSPYVPAMANSILKELTAAYKGGPGSGHRGHEGVKGQRGGSAPKPGGAMSKKISVNEMPVMGFMHRGAFHGAKVKPVAGTSPGTSTTPESTPTPQGKPAPIIIPPKPKAQPIVPFQPGQGAGVGGEFTDADILPKEQLAWGDKTPEFIQVFGELSIKQTPIPEKCLGGGVCASRKVTTPVGNAVVKDIHDTGGKFSAAGHDGLNEAAAYEISEMLGLDIVPPTVKASVNGKEVTAQFMIPDARDVFDEPNKTEVVMNSKTNRIRLASIVVLDTIIQNYDRHYKNAMFTNGSNILYAIDHGHAANSNHSYPNYEWMWPKYLGIDTSIIKSKCNPMKLPKSMIKRIKSITKKQFLDTLYAKVGPKGRKYNPDYLWRNLEGVQKMLPEF